MEEQILHEIADCHHSKPHLLACMEGLPRKIQVLGHIPSISLIERTVMTSIEVFTFLIVLQFLNRFLYEPVVLVIAITVEVPASAAGGEQAAMA